MRHTRRDLLRAGGLFAPGLLSACATGGASKTSPVTRVAKPTDYIAAYDTESGGCLEACRKIVEVHKKFEFPATFFIVGRTLEEDVEAYKKLLDDPLFEIASHTYSHQMLRNHPMCGDVVPPDELRKQILESKATIERTFDRECLGIRPACGFANAFNGASDALALISEAGYKYTSSLLWGPDYSLPALLTEPYNYAEDGHADIWELPGHGWHENLLKDNNGWGAKRLTLWPNPMPDAIPKSFLEGPEDEFNINRVFLDHAAAGDASFVSFVWHPWSLHRFDPEAKMLELTFSHARDIGMTPTTYADLYKKVAG